MNIEERLAPHGGLVMSFVLFLLFGVVVGALARLVVPAFKPGGWVVSMIIGIVGSFVGVLLGRMLFMCEEGEPAGFFMSLVGATLLVAGYHAMAQRSSAV